MGAVMKLSDAPGCIGSPLIRRAGHPLCADCKVSAICGKIALVQERKLCAALGVETLASPERRRQEARAPEVRAVGQPAAGLTKKGDKLLASLARQGVDTAALRRALDADDASFATATSAWKPEYLRIAVAVLRSQPSVRKSELRDALEARLGWGRLTAQSHVSIIVNALGHLGLIAEDGSTLRVKEAA